LLSSVRAYYLIVVFAFAALMATMSGVALGSDYGRNFRCPGYRQQPGWSQLVEHRILRDLSLREQAAWN
jgi:hypothetical protein